MNVHFLKNSEKKKLFAELDEEFGIENMDYLLVATGKQKIRGFSGHMSKDEIRELGEIAKVEIIGLYMFKRDNKFGLRMSLDGAGILGKHMTKNVVEISDSQVEEWFRGEDLRISFDRGIVVLKNGTDFLGCGVSDGNRIINFVPRERQVRKS